MTNTSLSRQRIHCKYDRIHHIFNPSVVIKNHAYVLTSPQTLPYFNAYITCFDVYTDFLRFNLSIMTGIWRYLTNSIMTETCLKNCKLKKLNFSKPMFASFRCTWVLSCQPPTLHIPLHSLLFPGTTLFLTRISCFLFDDMAIFSMYALLFLRKRFILTYKFWRHGHIFDVFVIFYHA